MKRGRALALERGHDEQAPAFLWKIEGARVQDSPADERVPVFLKCVEYDLEVPARVDREEVGYVLADDRVRASSLRDAQHVEEETRPSGLNASKHAG